MTEPAQIPPIACNLSAAGADAQISAWAALSAGCRRFERHERGATLWFDLAQEEALRAVAEVEARCCPFLSLLVSRDDDLVRLEIEAEQADARPVIEAIVTADAGGEA